MAQTIAFEGFLDDTTTRIGKTYKLDRKNIRQQSVSWLRCGSISSGKWVN